MFKSGNDGLKVETKTKKYKSKVILNDIDPLPVADTQMTIDGRYITDEELREIKETFDINKIKVGWYIGHIINFWMEKGKEPEKVGIVRDVFYKNGILYVYSQNLNKEFLNKIENGTYTDLSIEIMRLPVVNQKTDGEDTETEYKWHLTGIAAVKTGAYSRYGLVEYKEYEKDGTEKRIYTISNFNEYFHKKEEKNNMNTKEEKISNNQYTLTDEVENTKTEEKIEIDQTYFDNTQKDMLKLNNEIENLKIQVNGLKTTLEKKNESIDELNEKIESLDNTVLKQQFKIFYLKGLHENKLLNKNMGFDDTVNMLNIKLDDIYQSSMWRDYASSNEMKASIEKQLERGFFGKHIETTNYGNSYETRKIQSNNFDENDLYEYAKKLSIKEKGSFHVNDIKTYIIKAKKELEREKI